MNLSPRAANQLHALDHNDVAVILDCLRGARIGEKARVVDVTVGGQGFRCILARHKDGSTVLLAVIAPRGP